MYIQDSLSIEGSYGAKAGEAGGSYSQERTETRVLQQMHKHSFIHWI